MNSDEDQQPNQNLQMGLESLVGEGLQENKFKPAAALELVDGADHSVAAMSRIPRRTKRKAKGALTRCTMAKNYACLDVEAPTANFVVFKSVVDRILKGMNSDEDQQPNQNLQMGLESLVGEGLQENKFKPAAALELVDDADQSVAAMSRIPRRTKRKAKGALTRCTMAKNYACLDVEAPTANFVFFKSGMKKSVQCSSQIPMPNGGVVDCCLKRTKAFSVAKFTVSRKRTVTVSRKRTINTTLDGRALHRGIATSSSESEVSEPVPKKRRFSTECSGATKQISLQKL